MSAPKVAVITRTKDRALLLRRAIASVLGQRFTDWQLVIVNDGGAPAPVDALVAEHRAVLGDRVRVIHHAQSKGMEAASNAGLKASQSDYVVIHDDDDSWHPDFLFETVAFLENNPTLIGLGGVITHSLRVIERIENEQVIETARDPFNTWLEGVTLYRLAGRNAFPPISFVYKRRILDEIGYYREDLPVLGDWDFNLRFVAKYEIAVIPKTLAYYHHRAQAQSGAYGNTVVGGLDKHRYFDAYVRNELLRKELAAGTPGLGLLVGISHSFEELAALMGKSRESFFVYVKDKAYHLATGGGPILSRLYRLYERLT